MDFSFDELPYNVLKKIEDDEPLSTCQLFNAEVCYGAGLQYKTDACSDAVKDEIEDFCLDNNNPSYFLGVCQDFKHFGWCITVILLNEIFTQERFALHSHLSRKVPKFSLQE